MPLDPATTVANAAFSAMTGDADFDVGLADVSGAPYQAPAATGPLYAAIDQLDLADLTTGTVNGTGAFDKLMQAFHAQLNKEYEAGRISGAEYTKAYIAATEAAMSGAVQFLLGRDSAYWQAMTAQAQAQVVQVQLATARVELETAKAKLQLAAVEGLSAKATYALTKLKLATEQVSYELGGYNLENILPQQLALLEEQTEVQRAQTLDTRSDGVTDVEGVLGKQKDLYTQQITSYRRDAETKVAKLFTDAWITMKTIDEGLSPPTGFTNASLDEILGVLKVNNDLTA